MKKTNLLIAIIIATIGAFAQSPNSFKYQTVVRDFSGNIMANHNVSFQFSILQGSASGSSAYTETHSVTTNEFGLVNLNIGGGTSTDDFSTIDWGNGPYFIKVELDENGGTSFSEMGTSQLLSVPYAMYAKDVQNKDDADADPNNEFQTIFKSGNTVTLSNSGGSFTDEVNDGDISSTNELQIMNFSNDTLYLDNGGQVFLGAYSSLWEQNDTNIYYNNGWVGVGTSTPSGKMVVQGDDGVDPDSALFEVKNKEGQTIFAVYDGGVRIYIKEGDSTKSNTDKGGFAVGGYRMTKSTISEYFNINPSIDADTLNPSEARIYWYPLKEAFLSGRVLVESVDSVGLNSWASGFESKSIGDYSQALGYSARANGDNSTAIGYYANADSSNSYAFGNNAYAAGVNSYSLGDNAIVTKENSYAIGAGAQATGKYSFAVGSQGLNYLNDTTEETKASGNYSYAFGMGSVASGQGAFTLGTQDTASNYYSTAIGYKTKSSGRYSTSIGYMTTASYYYCTAMGNETTASGYAAVAMGQETMADGGNSTAMGRNTTASGESSTAIGYNTVADGTASFASGNGTNANASYSTSMGSNTTANGWYSVAMGSGSTTSNNYSIAMGKNATASNSAAIAMGDGTIAAGWNSTAMGKETQANAFYSTSMGYQTKANGNNSISTGDNTVASGKTSFAMGWNTTSKSFAEVVIGRFNDSTYSSNMTSWVSGDPIFIIGNGDDDANRKNAFLIQKNGFVGIGTSSPEAMLDIETGSNGFALHIEENGSGTDEWQIGVDATGDLNFFDGSLLEVTFENGGFVGIGTDNPGQTLDVFGDVIIGGGASDQDGNCEFMAIRARSDEWIIGVQNETSASTSDFYIGLSYVEDGIFHIENDGDIGIGTTTPGSHQLYVTSSTSGSTSSTGYFKNTYAGSGISLFAENSSASSSDVVLLLTTRGTGDIAKFYSYHGGGTGDLEFRFTNTGNGRCDGSWIAGGADYAEFFPKADITKEYEEGDIITLSPTKTYTVEGASSENSQLIVGVYSSNPAIVGNAEAEKDPENSVLVGMLGVVKTKVNTENGAIKIGDYITISSTERVGMKATKTGMVLGRAMDNYDKNGTGIINVLVETDWYYNTEEGNITSSEIKNTLNKQQSDIEMLKSEIEQLKQILEIKAEK